MYFLSSITALNDIPDAEHIIQIFAFYHPLMIRSTEGFKVYPIRKTAFDVIGHFCTFPFCFGGGWLGGKVEMTFNTQLNTQAYLFKSSIVETDLPLVVKGFEGSPKQISRKRRFAPPVAAL